MRLKRFLSHVNSKGGDRGDGREVQVSDKVRDHLYQEEEPGLGLVSLEDFASAVPSEDKCELFLEGLPSVEMRLRQISRLRQAWSGVRQDKERSEALQRRGKTALDREEPLSQADLDDLDTQFWNRYRFSFRAKVMPAVLLVSSARKEMLGRILSVRDVWAVKTFMYQMKKTRKKQKLTETVELCYTGKPEDEAAVPRTVVNYLALLFTLLLAYAMLSGHH